MLGFCQEQVLQVRNICCARHPCDFRLFRTPWRWGSTSSISCNYCQPPLTHQHSLSSLSSSRMWRLTDAEWRPRTAGMRYKADVSSNVGWGMLTRGYKNQFSTAWKQEREDSGYCERIKPSHPGEVWRTGRLTGWHLQRPWQRSQTNTQRQGALLTARGRDNCRPNSLRAQGKSMWKATLCSSEIIHQPRHWMNNTSSLGQQPQSHKLSPSRGKEKQSELGKTLQTRISKEEDLKVVWSHKYWEYCVFNKSSFKYTGLIWAVVKIVRKWTSQ